jgi:hypothetical protein
MQTMAICRIIALHSEATVLGSQPELKQQAQECVGFKKHALISHENPPEMYFSMAGNPRPAIMYFYVFISTIHRLRC